MNPYALRPQRVSRGLKDWQRLLGEPVAHEPLRTARLMLAEMVLKDAPSPSPGDMARDAALMRRVEWQHALGFASLLPRMRSCERVLMAVFLLTELTAAAALREKNARVRESMDFLLAEGCDMLYRTANFLSLEHGMSADEMLGRQAELMPGRPCIVAQRHPYDDVQRMLSVRERTAETYVSLYLLRAAAQGLSRMAAETLGNSCEDARALYAEIALIASAHETQYAGLLGTACSPAEGLALRAYALCCAFDMLRAQETEETLRQAYQEAFDAQCAHLHKVRKLMERGRETPPFLTENAPEPLVLQANKGYIRSVLRTVGVTLRRGEYLPVGTLPEGADFFRYQQKVVGDGLRVPSHSVVTAHILKNGQDFRAELAPHPVEMLRSRVSDPLCVGR